MEYKAIECRTGEVLNRTINRMLSEGWKPIGGVSASLSETDESQYYVIVQAMWRENTSGVV